MIGVLRRTFELLRQRRGEWTLFAVLYRGRRRPSPWDVAVAAPWLSEGRRLENLGEIGETVREATTDPRQMLDLGIVLMLTKPVDIAAAAAQLLNGRTIDHPVGLVRRKNFDLFGQTLRRGYVWSVNLPEPSGTSLVPTAPAA